MEMSFVVKPSKRISSLPVYPFVKLEQIKEKARMEKRDLIDFGIGDPDLPTPQFIIDAMKKAVSDAENHRYPTSTGMLKFREAASRFLEKRLGIGIPASQIVSLIGSKEGIAHFPLAVVNPGDVTLVPSPAYPVYKVGTVFADGKPYLLPLKDKNGFLPDLDAIPARVADKAKILFLNYPNNPTGAVCDREFFERAVRFAKKHGLLIVQDAAYCDVCFDGYQAPSIFSVKGATDCAIEFYSFSKTFNMTGWRIGFAAGAKAATDLLAKVKSNVDSGVFQAVQLACIAGMEKGDAAIAKMCSVYQRRRDLLCRGLDQMGLSYQKPKATFYIWVKTPKGLSSEQMSGLLLDQAGIITSPGSGYGPEGEGYVRFAIVVPEARIKLAVQRLKGIKL
jgi:LL-diaminopimelate aminotransferase